MSHTITPVHGESLEPVTEIQIVTESSLWLIRPDTYLRIPITEAPRDPTYAIAGRLDDHKWHKHCGATWHDCIFGMRVRIKPLAGPKNGIGIETGILQEVRGR